MHVYDSSGCNSFGLLAIAITFIINDESLMIIFISTRFESLFVITVVYIFSELKIIFDNSIIIISYVKEYEYDIYFKVISC